MPSAHKPRKERPHSPWSPCDIQTKTVDAYARNLDDLMRFFADTPVERPSKPAPPISRTTSPPCARARPPPRRPALAWRTTRSLPRRRPRPRPRIDTAHFFYDYLH